MFEAMRGTASTVPKKVEQTLYAEVPRALGCGWTAETLAKVRLCVPDC